MSLRSRVRVSIDIVRRAGEDRRSGRSSLPNPRGDNDRLAGMEIRQPLGVGILKDEPLD